MDRDPPLRTEYTDRCKNNMRAVKNSVEIHHTELIRQPSKQEVSDLRFVSSFAGLNKGTGTKTTVLMHVGVGDHVAETRDACVDTPWKDHVIATMSNLKHRCVYVF